MGQGYERCSAARRSATFPLEARERDDDGRRSWKGRIVDELTHDQGHLREAGGVSRRAVGRWGALALGGGALAATGSACSDSAPADPRQGSGSTAQAAVGFALAHEQFGTSELVQLAAAAESAGFSHAWASDHLQPWQDNQGHAMSP